jgi:hypothetical protein
MAECGLEQFFDDPPIIFGAYCSNISVSVGWNGQGGSMQFKLVEDLNPCPGDPVMEIDRDELNKLGMGFVFSYGALDLGGIYQRYSEEESSSGKTFNIVVESPIKAVGRSSFNSRGV